MSDRFLRVDISKKVTTSVFLILNDESCDVEKLKDKSFESKKDIIAEAVKETVSKSDWVEPWNPKGSDYEIESVIEIDENEADLYTIFDIHSKKIKAL